MKVLFVCSGNAYRSPVAEALLKKLKPSADVDSAGTDPAIPISEVAKKYLAREDALEYLKHAPEGLTGKNLSSYDLIVVMESNHKESVLRLCPQCLDKIVVWDVKDPYFLPFSFTEKIFDEIKEKVAVLANSLE